MKRIILYFIVFIGFISCKENTFEPAKNEYSFAYFPLDTTKTLEYKYTFINVDVVAGFRDTSIWFFRDRIAEEVIDSLDYKLYRLVREKRRSDTLPWEPATVWGIRKYDRMLVRVEENIPYVIFQFPEKVKKTWDGNLYNDLGEELYAYTALNNNVTIGNTPFDSVMVITQKNFKSLYTYQFKEEKYAYGVGLISKTVYDVESQPNHANINLTLPIEERITKGTIEFYELIP